MSPWTRAPCLLALIAALCCLQCLPAQLFGGGDRGMMGKKDGGKTSQDIKKTTSDSSTEAPKLVVAKPNEAEDKPYQVCKSIGDFPGHCRHIRYCLINEFRTNYTLVSYYNCPIEDKYVGVCCPDDRDTRPKTVAVKPLKSDEESEAEEARILASNTNRVDPIKRPSPLGPAGKNRGCGVAAIEGAEAPKGNGGVSDPGEYPWMAAIVNAKDDEQFCGGVVLDQSHVLTAAHCLIRKRQADIAVVLGEYDLTKPDETRSQKFKVVSIRRHERFDMHTYENDIAIFTLDRPAVFNTYVWPVCLPEPSDMKNMINKTAVVTGWGTMSYGGPAATVLMEVGIPLWSNSECQKRYSQPILKTAVCAGGYEGGKDSCQGDSGGPLMIQRQDGRWANIGVVSYGIKCGAPMQPGVYTKVTEYLDWIQKNV